jgi:serpin B
MADYHGNGNYMVSPTSLKMAMLLAACGANNNTLTEMLNVMGYESLDDYLVWGQEMITFEDNASKYFEDRKNSPWIEDYDAAFSIANGIWHNADMPGKFLDSYQARVHQLQAVFDNVPGEELKDKINQWINEQTQGMIPKMFNESLATQSNILVNTLYLKNYWNLPFDDSNTKEGEFTTMNGLITMKEMMEQTEAFKYYEDDGCQVLIMEMESGFNMAIVLGDNSGIVDKIGKTERRAVHVVLPKFEVESMFQEELKQFFIDSGMIDAFVYGETSDFSNMIDTDVVISKIIQKTRLEVNESGLKAAAATAITMENDGCAPEDPVVPVDFIADKPFTFYIYADSEELSNPELLFFGQYVE